jgi:MFS family permease
MPALVRSLGASPLAVSWLLTAYLVAASVATPLVGRLGDLLGRGRVLTWVMAVFCAGSVMCALGDSLGLLVAGRVLQGVAGGVFPLAYGIIRDTFPVHTRMRAIGSVSVSLGVGAALGPALAGIVVDHAGPAAIFWAGMLGAVPALCAGRLLRELPGRPRTPIDWSGAAVLAGALTALLVLMTQGQQLGWTSTTALALLAAAAGLFGWWVAIEGRRPAPLVDLRMLRVPTVALTNVAALCVGCGIFMAYVPLAVIAQAPTSTGYGLGMSVAAAGALLIPHGAVQIVFGPWAGSLCARVGSRAILFAGAVINTATMALIAAFHDSAASLLLAGAVLGLGQALALTAMANLVVGAVPAHDVGIATGINMVMRTVGMALGSALSAAILADGTRSAFPSDDAYVVAFAVAACVTAGAVACALAIPRLPRPDRGGRDVQTATRFSSGRTSRPIRSVLRS